MNVEIGAEPEATLFPEKDYINGIAVAVCGKYSQRPRILETENRQRKDMCSNAYGVDGIEILSEKGNLRKHAVTLHSAHLGINWGAAN
jgi:hypothetical protein